ncbi:MAG: hypothetical protein IPN09_15355 [Bacteroidetes bacterium]|nr:hypothetical protein [Bacteroidota bacterium]
MLQCFKPKSTSIGRKKKIIPIWYNTANINDDKIKETEEEVERAAAMNDKILAAQNIQFISQAKQSSEKQNLQEIKQKIMRLI